MTRWVLPLCFGCKGNAGACRTDLHGGADSPYARKRKVTSAFPTWADRGGGSFLEDAARRSHLTRILTAQLELERRV